MTHTPDHTTDHTEDRKKVAELIKKFRFAMFTTKDAHGKLVSRPLTVQEAEFDGDLWFLVPKSSAPAAEASGHAQANVALSSDDAWVSLSGTAHVYDDRSKIDQLWNPALDAWFPDGPEDPDIGVLKFTAESAEYWDSPGKIATALRFLTAKVSDKPADAGENRKVDL